jgi:hypothetical protein
LILGVATIDALLASIAVDGGVGPPWASCVTDTRALPELQKHHADTQPTLSPTSGTAPKEVYLKDPDGIRLQHSAVKFKLKS